jgi:hypothetical protein
MSFLSKWDLFFFRKKRENPKQNSCDANAANPKKNDSNCGRRHPLFCVGQTHIIYRINNEVGIFYISIIYTKMPYYFSSGKCSEPTSHLSAIDTIKSIYGNPWKSKKMPHHSGAIRPPSILDTRKPRA